MIPYCKMMTRDFKSRIMNIQILVMIGEIEVTSYIVIVSTALLAKTRNHMMKLTCCSDR